MYGRQINFYLTQDDILELANYLKKNNLGVIKQPIKDIPPTIVHQLYSEYNLNEWLKKIIVKPDNLEKLNIKFIPTQSYSLIDETKSEAIEFIQPYCNNDEKIMRHGRLYYTKQYYNAAGEVVQKDPEFLATADKLLRWIRKTFKDAKLPGYEGLLVSPRAAAWAQETGGKLLVNN